LALRQSLTVSPNAFMDHLYSGRDEPRVKIIDVMVCKLRGKLRLAGSDVHILTVWGQGYTLPAWKAAPAAEGVAA
jgi:two-component system cell cycle response regulator CtrA